MYSILYRKILIVQKNIWRVVILVSTTKFQHTRPWVIISFYVSACMLFFVKPVFSYSYEILSYTLYWVLKSVKKIYSCKDRCRFTISYSAYIRIKINKNPKKKGNPNHHNGNRQACRRVRNPMKNFHVSLRDCHGQEIHFTCCVVWHNADCQIFFSKGVKVKSWKKIVTLSCMAQRGFSNFVDKE